MSLSVLIVGSGMYVTGRGIPEYQGTIGPALIEAARYGMVERLGIVSGSPDSGLEGRSVLLGLAKQMGVKVEISSFGSIEIALAEFRPSAAVVAVPDHLHLSISKTLIQERVHCLMVKPLANNYEAAQEMARLSRVSGLLCYVEFHKRFDAANIYLKNTIMNGSLGRLINIHVEYSQKRKIPEEIFSGWAEHTNVFTYLGIHYVDLIRWLTEAEPIQVAAFAVSSHLKRGGINTYDAVNVNIKWMNPVGDIFESQHNTSWIDPNTSSSVSDQRIEVLGTGGRFRSDQKNRGIEFVSNAGIDVPNPYFTFADRTGEVNKYSGYGIDSIHCFLKDVCCAVTMESPVAEISKDKPTFENCLVAHRVVGAVLESLETEGSQISLLRNC